MMIFDGMPVPAPSIVEIVEIRHKDGSPLEEDNWRRNLFGRFTYCWIAGGLKYRGAFFSADIRKVDGKFVVMDLHDNTWCSTTAAQPIEVEPDVFDFETNTSIYRFRRLSEAEEADVVKTVRAHAQLEIAAFYRSANQADANIPPS